MIEEDDELSHHGGEGYFLGFTGSDQAGVKRLKYGVIRAYPENKVNEEAAAVSV